MQVVHRLLIAIIAVCGPLQALQVTLFPSAPSPQPLGTEVTWTATIQQPSSDVRYRFSVREPGETWYRVVRDFHPNNVFRWATYEVEGFYSVQVTARDKITGEESSAAVTYYLSPRALFSAVLSATTHRLVVLYSAPACPAGSFIRVRFQAGNEAAQATPWKECVAFRTRNFLLAGLRASQSYSAFHEVATNGNVTASRAIPFTTIGLPAHLVFPTYAYSKTPNLSSCLLEGVTLHSSLGFVPGQTSMPVATDIAGRIVWYYPEMASDDQGSTAIFRVLPGGNMLVALNDATSVLKQTQILREIDLVGNTVRETNVERVNEQLAAMGKEPITSFHHEAIRLPNGNVIGLTSVERVLTDKQGPGAVDVAGDALVELDARTLAVKWFWSSFDHMDTSRMATLGETCTTGQGGCPPILAADGVANDWTHMNSVHYTIDGDLILSVRHQDWVIKIDYNNGTGTGALVWRLGKDGDFTIVPGDQSLWFSHQHDAEYDIPGLPLLSLYDNGNLRNTNGQSANSRGQVFWIDETNRRATVVVNADLGAYAFAVGSAELLCNGNYSFNSGVISPELKSESVEVLGSGAINAVLTSNNPAYRTFRLYNMYRP